MAASKGRSNGGRPDVASLADEAEAEAAEAEAAAAAARARAKAIRARLAAESGTVESGAEDQPGGSVTHTQHAETLAELDLQTPSVDEAEPGDKAGDDAEPLGGIAKPGDDAEPADDVAGSATSSKRRRWIRVVAAAATIAIVLGLCGASGYLVWHHHVAARDRQREAEFASAARQAIVNLTSLDFHRAKDDVQRVIDSSTGAFRDDFTRRATDFTATMERAKIVTEGTVNAAAVDLQSMNANSAVVLVTVSSRVSNSAGAQQEPRHMRLVVTMVREGGQLKMSKVEFVP